MLEAIAQAIKSSLEGSLPLTFALVFAGGIFTGFSPCTLPFFPAIMGYVAKNTQGSRSSGREGFILSLLFVLGFSSTFAIIGAFASYLGGLASLSNRTWYYIVGAVFIVFGLHFMRVLRLNLSLPVNLTADSIKFRGLPGSFILGILVGLILSPCATPVVAVILTYVASKGNAVLGGALLFTYSIAHGLPLMAAGTSTGFINKTALLQKHRNLVEIISGAIFVLLGLYFLSQA